MSYAKEYLIGDRKFLSFFLSTSSMVLENTYKVSYNIFQKEVSSKFVSHLWRTSIMK